MLTQRRVTYLNTSSFTVYLIPFALKRIFSSRNSRTTREQYQVINQASDTDDQIVSDALSSRLFIERSQNGTNRNEHPPLTTRETIRLAFVFCFIWFVANWSVNASLDYTSVASATIMSSMSGPSGLPMAAHIRLLVCF